VMSSSGFSTEQCTLLTNIEIKEKLSTGNFGQVFRGVWNGKDVALKNLLLEDQKSFLNEVCVLEKLKHPNIIGTKVFLLIPTKMSILSWNSFHWAV